MEEQLDLIANELFELNANIEKMVGYQKDILDENKALSTLVYSLIEKFNIMPMDSFGKLKV